MREKLLIERYLTYLRVSEERAQARIKQQVVLDLLSSQGFSIEMARAYGVIHTSMADRSLKYQLAASAQTMVEVLRPHPLLREDMTLEIIDALAGHRREQDPDIETPIHTLPDGPIWIELEQPISVHTGYIAAMFFTSSDREIEREREKPQSSARRAVLEKAARQPSEDYRWSLHFIDKDGTPRSQYEYLEQAQEWAITPDREPCPTDECIVHEEVSDVTGRRDKHIIPCVFCGTLLGYWRSWFVTALLAVQGEYAATDEREWPIRTEHDTRKVQRPGSGKYDEKPVSHDYYIVSFDASIKKRSVVVPEREPQVRGSWVAAAQDVDLESVVYVRHDFGQGKRELDPERNPRWKQKQTIDVRAHARRVPMKVSSLQRKITRVIASRYEKKVDE